MLTRRLLLGTLLFLTATSSGRAHAQSGAGQTAGGDDPDRKAAARALFEEGLASADARRWSQAADRFERARALRSSPEITYNLSAAHARLGHLVRAADLLREITWDGQAGAQVKAAARSRLLDILPRLAFLKIEAPRARLQRASVLMDGRPLEEPRLGVAVPVDPTSHSVQLREGTVVVAWREVTLREGERRTVDLGVTKPGEDLAARLPAGQFLTWDAPAAELEQKADAPKRRHTWAWLLLGAVVAGVATTAVVMANRDPETPSANVATWTLGSQ